MGIIIADNAVGGLGENEPEQGKGRNDHGFCAENGNGVGIDDFVQKAVNGKGKAQHESKIGNVSVRNYSVAYADEHEQNGGNLIFVEGVVENDSAYDNAQNGRDVIAKTYLNGFSVVDGINVNAPVDGKKGRGNHKVQGYFFVGKKIFYMVKSFGCQNKDNGK